MLQTQNLSAGRLRTRLFKAVRAMIATEPIEFRVRGDSMAPGIRDGATVLLASSTRYRPGDIVAFKNSAGALVLHRLLGPVLSRSRGWVWVTRGDGAHTEDGLVDRDAILGVMVGGDHDPGLLPVPPRARSRAVGDLLRYVVRRAAW